MNTFLTLLLTAVSIALGWLISRYYAQRRGLSYFLEENSIISPFGLGDVPDLEVFFRSAKINGLSQIKFALWNSGNQALKRDNFSTIDPFGLTLPDCKILDNAQVVESNKSIGASLVVNDDTLFIHFDMLDQRDAIVGAVLIDTTKEDQTFSGVHQFTGKIEGMFQAPTRCYIAKETDYFDYVVVAAVLALGIYMLSDNMDHITLLARSNLPIISIIGDTNSIFYTAESLFVSLGVVYIVGGVFLLSKLIRVRMRRPPKFVWDQLGLQKSSE